MPKAIFNPFTNKPDFVDDGTDSQTVTSSGTLTDNSIVRGDGGSRGVQDCGILIDDADNITSAESLTFNLGTNVNEFSVDGTLSGDSDDVVPTEKAVKTYVDNSSSTLPITTKGDLLTRDSSSNVRLAVGIIDGQVLTVDSTESSGLKWTTVAGTGDVVGPAGATDNAIARYDTATGKLIQDSGVIIDDADAITGVSDLTLNIGTGINEFSTDGTLGGNSDNALPTEKAVKTYADTKQTEDAFLTSIAALGTGADKGIYTTGVDTAAEFDLTAAGRAILDDANAGAQRTTLGVAIGSDVQAWDAQLDDIAALAVTNSNFIVGDGANWVAESGATARTSLGLTIGTDVQAYDAALKSIADNTGTAADKGIYYTAANTAAEFALTAFGRANVALATLTDHGVLFGSGAGAITASAALTNGQLVVGNTGSDPSITTLTDGDNITITEGAGTITIAADDPPDMVFGGRAIDHDLNLTKDTAVISYEDLGTVELRIRDFANATSDQEEYMQGSFRIPDDIDSSGTVTFEVHGWSETAAASKNVQFTIGYRTLGDSDAIDGAYTDDDSGDLAVDATQDDLDILTWTETVSNLGWGTGGELVLYQFSRPAATANDLVGSYFVYNFFIRVPMA